jgi:hypothetical protein
MTIAPAVAKAAQSAIVSLRAVQLGAGVRVAAVLLWLRSAKPPQSILRKRCGAFGVRQSPWDRCHQLCVGRGGGLNASSPRRLFNRSRSEQTESAYGGMDGG